MNRGPVFSRLLVLLAVLVSELMLAGCASVPGSSPVDVIRDMTRNHGPDVPPEPGDNLTAPELVFGFLKASANPENHHAAARLFLDPAAQHWADGASLTILDDNVSTAGLIGAANETDRAVVRLQATQLGRLNADGTFVPDQNTLDLEFRLVRVHGQWRLDNPPPGVIVRLQDFRANYRAVPLSFVDPTTHNPVADRRYILGAPKPTLPARVLQGLFRGPSDALAGAAASALPSTARLRSNVVLNEDGSVIVDLTELGDLDDITLQLIAQQVVLSLANVGCTQVTLLNDGAPLVSGHRTLTSDYFAGLGRDGLPSTDVPGLAVIAGGARTLNGDDTGSAAPGSLGSGAYDLVNAAMSPDGQRAAAVSTQGGRHLLVGPASGALAESGVYATSLSAPSWTPDSREVWTVRNSTTVTRVVFDQAGHPSVQPVDAEQLTTLGPINDLKVSGNGAQVAAVVGGQLAVGTVIRTPNSMVAIHDVRLLRPADLSQLISVAWSSDDQVVVAGHRSAFTVARVSSDGLDLRPVPSTNLTPPVVSVAAGPGRPLLVTDQNGLWSFGVGEVGSWRRLASGPAIIAGFPG